MVCLPGITVAAIFTSMILLDLYKREWRRIPGHILLGIFALLFILFLCERTSEGVAWMLILAPFLFAILGWIIHELVLKLYGNPSDTATIEPRSNCSCCNQRPCRRRPQPRPCHEPRPFPKPCPRPEPKPEPEPSKDCIKTTLDT
jgi:hypothetical protein